MAGPIVAWQNNDGTKAAPPADGEEWVSIAVKAVGHDVFLLIFTTNGKGSWWVSKAEQSRVNVGPGPWPIAPIDHRAAVVAALKAAGKPILD